MLDYIINISRTQNEPSTLDKESGQKILIAVKMTDHIEVFGLPSIFFWSPGISCAIYDVVNRYIYIHDSENK